LGLLEVSSPSKVCPISFTAFILPCVVVATLEIRMVAGETGGIMGVWSEEVFGFTIRSSAPVPLNFLSGLGFGVRPGPSTVTS
jgi:hypothetical protein